MNLLALLMLTTVHVNERELSSMLNLHASAWEAWSTVEYNIKSTIADAAGTRFFGEVQVNQTLNGTHIKQMDAGGKVAYDVYLYPGRMVTHTVGMDVVQHTDTRKVFGPVDGYLMSLRKLNWNNAQILTLLELASEKAANLKLVNKAGDLATLQYCNNQAAVVVTLDLSKNGMISKCEATFTDGKNKGGVTTIWVNEWAEPQPGKFFPKRTTFRYTNASKNTSRTVTSEIKVIKSQGIGNIPEWTNPRPGVVYQDGIRNIQTKIRADGSKEKDTPLLKSPFSQPASDMPAPAETSGSMLTNPYSLTAAGLVCLMGIGFRFRRRAA